MSHLPGDILFTLFDHLNFDVLLTCSQVDAHWRMFARAHPTYWKRLTLLDTAGPGGVALFIARLNAKRSCDSTIDISLRWRTRRDDFTRRVLPALEENLNRVESLSLFIAPIACGRLWDVFRLRAQRLRCLRVRVEYDGRHPTPLPAIFNAHCQETLESVVLVDVLLPERLTPLSHPLKDITVFVTPEFATPNSVLLERVIYWAPRVKALGIWCCAGSPFSTADPSIKKATLHGNSVQFSEADHLAFHCEDWVAVMKWLATPRTFPSLTVRSAAPSADDVRSVLPTGTDLCVCIRSQENQGWLLGRVPAMVAISTPDRKVVRVFEHIYTDHLLSHVFLGRFFPFTRLVTLVVSLTTGFMDMCDCKYAFPNLKTLSVGLSFLPEEQETWRNGGIECPQLRTLAFQNEYEDYTPVLSQRAVESFVSAALVLRHTTRLRLILRGVHISESGSIHRFVDTVLHVQPGAPWGCDTDPKFSSSVRMSTSWIEIE
ncbi:hypothetical protein AURDEDRAFT_125284 [Auricularia subglabra TFB-10046 SS5]|nr:hypothetical protein AURDEDRAFT_125284 [Auricularia subglabra TFB-10046 SS5]